jgi:hypothetical protein
MNCNALPIGKSIFSVVEEQAHARIIEASVGINTFTRDTSEGLIII